MPYTYGGFTPGGNYGDYYRGDYYVGDPFLGGIFKKVGKAIGGAVTGFISGGPVGAFTGAARGLLSKSAQQQSVMGTALAPFGPDLPTPGQIKIRQERGPEIEAERARQRAWRAGKRRRMNYMNDRALKRAGRRLDGFTKGVRRALKHTPYTLVRRGSRGRGGSPGVITKAEASRALRK